MTRASFPSPSRAVMRRSVIGALAVVALGFSGLSVRSFFTSAGSTQANEAPLATGLLSPRRLPDAMADAAADQTARSAVTRAVGSNGLDKTKASITIDREGREVLGSGDELQRTPASSMKLVTATAALGILGVDSKFTTTVEAANSTSNGIVDGPLYLVGGGDPLLFSDEYAAAVEGAAAHRTPLSALADAVVAAGVKRVNGSVLGDDSRFDRQRGVPTWSPSYALQGEVGPISALSVDQGFASFAGGKVGASDPAAFAASKFTELLRARGVTVSSAAGTGNAPEKAKTVAEIESAPLSDAVDQMLTYSDNTTAEMLIKNMGVKASGSGTTDSGTAAVKAFLDSAGLGSGSYVGRDGSGLDRNNRLSCGLLQSVMARGESAQIIRDGLPEAGKSGTLRDRMTGTAAVGRVQAKTGTLQDVSALAGWAAPTNAAAFTFCMITNGISTEAGRQLEDNLAVALASVAAGPDANAFAP